MPHLRPIPAAYGWEPPRSVWTCAWDSADPARVYHIGTILPKARKRAEAQAEIVFQDTWENIHNRLNPAYSRDPGLSNILGTQRPDKNTKNVRTIINYESISFFGTLKDRGSAYHTMAKKTNLKRRSKEYKKDGYYKDYEERRKNAGKNARIKYKNVRRQVKKFVRKNTEYGNRTRFLMVMLVMARYNLSYRGMVEELDWNKMQRRRLGFSRTPRPNRACGGTETSFPQTSLTSCWRSRPAPAHRVRCWPTRRRTPTTDTSGGRLQKAPGGCAAR